LISACKGNVKEFASADLASGERRQLVSCVEQQFILTGPQRRRRWSVSEKLEIVAETRDRRRTFSG
jgi:hypothetical protein